MLREEIIIGAKSWCRGEGVGKESWAGGRAPVHQSRGKAQNQVRLQLWRVGGDEGVSVW